MLKAWIVYKMQPMLYVCPKYHKMRCYPSYHWSHLVCCHCGVRRSSGRAAVGKTSLAAWHLHMQPADQHQASQRGQLGTSEDKWGQHHEGGADTGPAGASHIRWVLVTVDNIYTYFNKVRKQQHLRKLMGKLQCRVMLICYGIITDGWCHGVQCCSAVRARAEVLGVLGRLRWPHQPPGGAVRPGRGVLPQVDRVISR